MNKHEIIVTATEPSDMWSNTELATFHFLNANGLYWKKMLTDDRVSEAVGEGKCNTGALFAYGSFRDDAVNKLAKIAMQKRVSRTRLGVVLDTLKKDIERAESFLNTLE